jgi:RNA polymerase sigma-70 factor (sigma-E family)
LQTAYLVVWDLPEAEDIVQEGLLVVARRWPRVRSMDHPLAYARRVVINLALDGAKRRTRRKQELEPHGSDPVENRADEEAARELGGVDLKSELIAALGTLPARQRAVIVLRYFGDLSEAQIAATLGCSTGTVKSTASRALARLERALSSTETATVDHDTLPTQVRSSR